MHNRNSRFSRVTLPNSPELSVSEVVTNTNRRLTDVEAQELSNSVNLKFFSLLPKHTATPDNVLLFHAFIQSVPKTYTL
jgi:hypothetical protein